MYINEALPVNNFIISTLSLTYLQDFIDDICNNMINNIYSSAVYVALIGNKPSQIKTAAVL